MPCLKKNVPFIMLVISALACAIPGISLENTDAVSTNAAETIIAGLTLNAPATPLPSTTPSLTMTFTPTLIYLTARFPSQTPSLTKPPGTETVTLEPTATFTPPPIKMSVSRPTHCRAGPGKSYEIVGSLLVGMEVEVIGRDPTSQYWYIPNPYVFTDYCWVWGEYAVFEGGNQLLLPVVTPPPTPTHTATTVPTIDFKLQGQGMFVCDKTHWVNLTITNESGYPLSSIRIVMQDTVKNNTRSVTYNNFPITTGCNGLTWVETVPGNGAVTVTGPKFDYNIHGNKMHVTVTVCSEK
ncbi:MAG: SH3 domain-containing protein, partial [Chloroflexi bacterium]|nr:SH3 domain-containing protein [Chloroflexota bacterium]